MKGGVQNRRRGGKGLPAAGIARYYAEVVGP